MDRLSSQKEMPLSVSAAMAQAKAMLESVPMRLVGEVSEVSDKAGYKAVYFTVKDEQASLPCQMWLNRYRSCGVVLVVGQLVELVGRFTLYAKRGRMNFEVFSIELAGEGSLRLKVAALARKLEAEGLMSSSRKRPVPKMPLRIGLVTSPRGAAVHDCLRTLRRRFPAARVFLAGVAVEGQNAPAGIIEGIKAVVAAQVEVVLIVRGGGSFEDLMPFNDEALARAISACPVCVVTGIGHEPDTSIADMVADLRASTPTAAAEAVSPSSEEMKAWFSTHVRRMNYVLNSLLERSKSGVQHYALRPVFQDPMQLFAADALHADDLYSRMQRVGALNIVGNKSIDFAHLKKRFKISLGSAGQASSKELAARAARLHDLSPLAVLGRGYAFARNAQGEVIRSVSGIKAGDELSVSVSDGVIVCEVQELHSANR